MAPDDRHQRRATFLRRPQRWPREMRGDGGIPDWYRGAQHYGAPTYLSGGYEGPTRDGPGYYHEVERGHRGKGPRNYARSDARISEEINDRMTEDADLDAREIDLDVSKGEATLWGTVHTKLEKRVAEHCAEAVAGITHVQNNLRISDSLEEGHGAGGDGRS